VSNRALGDPLVDFDVMLIEGRARSEPAETAAAGVDDHLARYRRQLSDIGLDRDEYLRTYSATIRIEPTRVLAWSGRSHLAAVSADISQML
jgi:aminoglycoside phosphotransferase (APT) family kinase protein